MLLATEILITASATDAIATGGAIGFIFIFIIGACFLGLWIWSIIHCIQNKQLSDANRIIGIVLIVILGLIGSLIYLCLPRERKSVRRRSRQL
jgi:ABC-type Mn2+/Zn2+ transport system permease subunit